MKTLENDNGKLSYKAMLWRKSCLLRTNTTQIEFPKVLLKDIKGKKKREPMLIVLHQN